MNEKILHKKSTCAYCGDAPVSHTLSYINGVLSVLFDFFFNRIFRWVPKFILRGVDALLGQCLSLLVWLKVVRLSDDPDKAATLRSRVIWDEAARRGLKMEQLVIWGKYTDNYRVRSGKGYFYFNSLPAPSAPLLDAHLWDDKFFLKKKLAKKNIPLPKHAAVPHFKSSLKKLFARLETPLIVKPRVGSRGRHTTTNIRNFHEFEKAVRRARVISPQVVAEEYLEGYVCRATCVYGKLEGFYRAEGASVVGDGVKSISQLIEEKNNKRGERIAAVALSTEILDFVGRHGFDLDSVLPPGQKLALSHRTGRLFGGATREMREELHPSFVPIIEQAAEVIGLSVIGLDCIIADPEAAADGQRWGIIECNTLPFIDLHYYALEGRPRNIAGLIWDGVEARRGRS